MTNLTDKWKKGELPSGWYYVKLIRGEYRTDLYIKDKNEWIDCPDKIISEVLAEVPSYEELQNQAFILKSRESEIVKLKELLKRCKRIIEIDEYVSITGAGRDILWDLLQDLKQVLGEE